MRIPVRAWLPLASDVRPLRAAVLALLTAAAGLLPTLAAVRMNASADEAAVYAAALRTPVFAPADPLDPDDPDGGNEALASAVPLLRAERAPDALWRAAQEHHIGTEMTAFSLDWPEPHCLAIWIDGTEVFSSDVEVVIPASVQKLITAAAALAVVDPAEQLVTQVLTDAEIVDGVLDGTVWVVGGGDPLIMTQSYADSHRRQPQLRTPMEDLADELVGLGIRSLRGKLIADESRYDANRFPETWPQRYVTQLHSGPLSALSLNDGITGFTTALTAAVHPARWFVSTLADLLTVRGVSVDVEIDVSAAPSGMTEIARLKSPPLIEIIQQMLRESDNTTAELMLREIGLRSAGEGSTPAGAAAAARIVSEMLPQQSPPVVVDGSGLDRQNQLSCSLLTALLDSFGTDSAVAAGLPIAARTGTLSHRFAEHPVAGRLHAKTGLLTGVNSLAGFVHTDSGTVMFAQILNGVPVDSRLGLELQESLVGQLLRYPVGDAAALRGLTRGPA
ncbi:D-alanyl-D-alanine carboxypeptidase/D-alanyl-D-alanine endopeptidase [Candidatus Poriferisodalis sp.]|uniref:D-alanyl-D-alanine carboxypeptidase/D-alanyl-D-alanine endopeptidase n=1 Tax=Candidatus Poriferisodalis sp. TaxID=3101277 RepID=UPI003B58BF58